jgi:hypothetical protein
VRRLVSTVVVVWAVAACKGQSPAASVPSDAGAPRQADCQVLETIELAPKSSGVVDGLRVFFDGTQHDQYDDGHTELSAVLVLEADGRRETRWVSLYGPSGTSALGHCLRTDPVRDALRVGIGRTR